MIDHFAVFGEPRRPWLDPEALKAKFLALSADVHPDRTHNAPADRQHAAQQRYAELNAAYQCLREPKERLQLLLELECGQRPERIQQIDSAGMSRLIEVGQLCRAADALIEEQARETSPLLLVGLFERAAQIADQLKELQAKLKSQHDALELELWNLNLSWEPKAIMVAPQQIDASLYNRLAQMHREFSYLRRWSQQLQDRIVRLSAAA